MSASEFRVLFHLCDCHNPSKGCFPTQAYLIANTGASNGTVNNALNSLEAKGLIQRQKGRDPKTKRQRPTHYILGFEIKKPQEPSPKTGDGSRLQSEGRPVSNLEADPSPAHWRVTCKEPVSNLVCAAHTHPRFEDFWKAYPRPKDREATEAAFCEAVAAGESPDTLIAGAKAYAEEQRGNGRQYLAGSDSWLKHKRWRDHPPLPEDDAEKRRAVAERMAASPIESVSATGRQMLAAINQ